MTLFMHAATLFTTLNYTDNMHTTRKHTKTLPQSTYTNSTTLELHTHQNTNTQTQTH